MLKIPFGPFAVHQPSKKVSLKRDKSPKTEIYICWIAALEVFISFHKFIIAENQFHFFFEPLRYYHRNTRRITLPLKART